MKQVGISRPRRCLFYLNLIYLGVHPLADSAAVAAAGAQKLERCLLALGLDAPMLDAGDVDGGVEGFQLGCGFRSGHRFDQPALRLAAGRAAFSSTLAFGAPSALPAIGINISL